MYTFTQFQQAQIVLLPSVMAVGGVPTEAVTERAKGEHCNN